MKTLKRTAVLTIAFILHSLSFSPFCAAGMEETALMVNGKYAGRVQSWESGGKTYLNAGRIMDLLGGKLYRYPVSGRLLLQLKGKQARFLVNSDEVIVDGEKMRLTRPAITRGVNVFVSLAFFTSKHFTGMLGMELSYNGTTRVLSAEKKANIIGLNYFSYGDKTRLVLELKSPLEYHVAQKSRSRLDVLVIEGTPESEEILEINDGVLEKAVLSDEKKTARLVLFLGPKAGKWNVFRLREPDRIVADILTEASFSGPEPDAAVPSEISVPAVAVLPAIRSSGVPISAELKPRKTVEDGSGNMPDNSSGPSGGSGGEGAAEPAAGARSAELRGQMPAGGEVFPPALQPGGDARKKTARKRIVIDAGHGGKDPGGKKISGLSEKELNLRVAVELADLLKEEDVFDVLMTRTSDVFIPLAERPNMANNFDADIFISIHANACPNRKENGFEVYFMSENASDPWAAEVAAFENSVLDLENGPEEDPAALLLHSMARNEYINEASQLAGFISREISRRTPFTDRGVKQAAFYVLRGTYCPAVLLEMGFMTNSRDRANLSSRKVRKKMASAIYSGIIEFAKIRNWK
ncbi:MAG: N-acetylmuramoyl-L-alanine amidase [bacterium]